MPKVIADDQILDAVIEIVTLQGYAGATTREIAAAAGINEVTLFRRFGSKKKLLTAAVEREAEKFGVANIRYSGDVQADLTRVVVFYQTLVETRGHMVSTLFSEIPRQPELLDVIRTPLAIIANFAALIARYQQEGVLIEEPPMQALIELIGPIFLGGILTVVNAQPHPGTADPAAQVHRYLDGRAVQAQHKA